MEQPTLHHYGPGPLQYGELWRPGGPSRGTVIFIHGGFWRARHDLHLGRPLAADLIARGYTAWNLEYRRVGVGGGWPTTFADVAAGIDLLATLDVDTSRVVAVGHSAGGHLATWAAGRAKLPAGTPGSPETVGSPEIPGSPQANGAAEGQPAFVAVTAVVSLAGVLALADSTRDGTGGTAAVDLMGGGPEERAEEYRLADPMTALPLAAPVLCLHSRADVAVPYSYSERYVAAATAAGGRAALTETHGDHMTLVDPASPDWAVVTGALPGLLSR